jgi:hypothetical protein
MDWPSRKMLYSGDERRQRIDEKPVSRGASFKNREVQGVASTILPGTKDGHETGIRISTPHQQQI